MNKPFLQIMVVLLIFITMSVIASNSTAGSITYTYDKAGRLTKADYGNGSTITYTYDETGNILTETVVSAVADTYEPDDSSGQATMITPGVPQTHSISPVGDKDWVTFTLASTSGIVINTSGSSGNTVMRLYNSSLNLIETNDNGGVGKFSKIDRICGADELLPGAYYVKINETGNNDVIYSYDILLAVTPCKTSTITVNRVSDQQLGWLSPRSIFYREPEYATT